MTNRIRVAATAATASVALIVGADAAHGQENRPRIVLHLTDYTGHRKEFVRLIEIQAATIFSAAGVDIVWVEQTPEAGQDRPLEVLMITAMMASRNHLQDDFRSETLGVAVHAARRAYVYGDLVTIYAANRHVQEHRLLAYVLAHEIGHLVLPEHSHSDTGIMRAGVDLHGAWLPGFTAEQGAVIRTVAQRMR